MFFLKHGMSKFGEGERVLCFHGPLLYEARCHKVNTEGEVSFIFYNLNLVVRAFGYITDEPLNYKSTPHI